MSSVAPTDSVSNQPRRSKPGKRERQANRSAIGSTSGAPASATKAAAFATGVGDPIPQPGKFPVVFPTGAGEPTRDQEFAIPLPRLSSTFPSVVDKYKRNARYAEFRAHSDFSDAVFGAQLSASFLLRLSQQVVHAHVNMGLPQGDFAPVSSSEVKIPQALAAVVRQFGEFSVPALGTRFLLADYECLVKRLILSASQVWLGQGTAAVLTRSWLPMSNTDKNFKALIAFQLNQFLADADLRVLPTVLEDAVLSGAVPDAWEEIKSTLGNPPDEGERDQRDRFDFVFKAQADEGHFTTAWTTAEATSALAELNLYWPQPQAGHLNWSFPAKQTFSSLAEQWARVSTTYSEFFELSSGLVNRSEASGTPSQLAEVVSVEGVTVVKTLIALSAPEFSLAACFPPTCVFVGGVDRRVVVTTSVNVGQRATEFCQLDWR
nr:coat protein [Aspergillus ochraceopetaliformis partitivirus 1]WRU22294.1 coat protein [Aspergillus ochraceopetaliformis partitivirus 1]